MVNFQNFLDETIHYQRHLETVYEPIDYLMLSKIMLPIILLLKQMKKFYQSTDLDHENYVLPEDLLAAAIARTQFFHGGVYALLLERFAPTSFAYSLSLIHIETINTLIKPEYIFISLVE